MDHTLLLRSITRYARTVREPTLVLAELDEAIARAFGECGGPGPAYLDFPTDTLRSEIPKAVQLAKHIEAQATGRGFARPSFISTGLWMSCGRSGARWSISGRGARGQGPNSSPCSIGCSRLSRHGGEPGARSGRPSLRGRRHAGAVMGDADVVLTVGRRLDFQLAYGSPAVFSAAQEFRAHRDVPANCATTGAGG